MSESPGQYRLLSPLSRVETDAAGHSQRVRYGVGDVITPSAAELQAFGDRLVDVLAPPAPAGAGGPRLNPELYAIIKRANAGTATADEHQVAGDLLDYMEKHAQGTATADDTAAMELVLTEFGMPLFA